MKYCLALCLFFALPLLAQDTVHRCKSPDGTIVFSDEPCGNPEPVAETPPEATESGEPEERWCDAPARLWLAFDVFQANADVALNDVQKIEVDALLSDLHAEGMIDTPMWRMSKDDTLHLCGSRKVGDRIQGILARNGERRVVKRGFVKLMNDPETPIALRGRCVGGVQACMQDELAVFDTCVMKMPSCSLREPWRDAEVCCPLECKQRFVRLRERKVPASTAFDLAIHDDGGCIPGIEASR